MENRGENITDVLGGSCLGMVSMEASGLERLGSGRWKVLTQEG